MAYSETDPLLPNVRSAPEISEYRLPGNGEYPLSADINDDEFLSAESPETEQLPSVDFKSLLLTTLTTLIWVAVFIIVVFPTGFFWHDRLTIEARVERILSNTPLIDGHNDLAIALRYLYGNHIYNKNFTRPFEDGGLYGQVDLPRLKKGKVGGAFWSAYTSCPADGDDFSDNNYAEAVRQTYQQIDILQRLFTAYPKYFSPTHFSSFALPAFAQGRLISPLGIEGLHQIGNSFSTLRSYYGLGVRYATLTHNCHNAYADAALTMGPNKSIVVSKPLHHGLSSAGVVLIREMNRMGMIVDLSHVSHDTMLDSLGGNPSKFPGGSAAPAIFSHSSSYALCPHPRNVPDSILPLIRATNSLIMVNFSPDFISCTPASPDSTTGIPDFLPANSTLDHVVAHIKHIGDAIGYAHVGLGSDFDGILSTPRGLEDVSKFPALVAGMLRQGISDEDVGKVVGGNVLRVWRDVETVAERLQRDGQRPREDDLQAIFHPPEA
ncbi:hypothetical protein FGG08_002193 [Glutinoglossum americanum]|uniref:Dipeptidase n=1 Tax=Glutinoglossum americanum TaxID=1670608 RepID=A0A9P8I6U0_9PEZI|nr:hypothetical protein FGG08_002193 [Glutinoglossum americanum]